MTEEHTEECNRGAELREHIGAIGYCTCGATHRTKIDELVQRGQDLIEETGIDPTDPNIVIEYDTIDWTVTIRSLGVNDLRDL